MLFFRITNRAENFQRTFNSQFSKMCFSIYTVILVLKKSWAQMTTIINTIKNDIYKTTEKKHDDKITFTIKF